MRAPAALAATVLSHHSRFKSALVTWCLALSVGCPSFADVILSLRPQMGVSYVPQSFGLRITLTTEYLTGNPSQETCGDVNPENVTLVLTLPAGTAFVSESDGRGVFEPATQTVTWNLATLDSLTHCFGTEISTTIDVDSSTSAGTILHAAATIGTTTPGDDPFDNQGTESFRVGLLPLEVRVDRWHANLGCAIDYGTPPHPTTTSDPDGFFRIFCLELNGIFDGASGFVEFGRIATTTEPPGKLGELDANHRSLDPNRHNLSISMMGTAIHGARVEAGFVYQDVDVLNPNPFSVPLRVIRDSFWQVLCRTTSDFAFIGSRTVKRVECGAGGFLSTRDRHEVDTSEVPAGGRLTLYVMDAGPMFAAATAAPLDDASFNARSRMLISLDDGVGYFDGLTRTLEFRGGSPVNLLVTDSNGRRVGSVVTVITEPNLAKAAGVLTNVSSFYPGWPPEQAIDGDINTSWFTADGDAVNLGTTPFFEILLPEDATVTELRMFGNRESAEGYDFFAGIFQLFDAAGTVLFDSGEVALPAPDRDITLSIPDVSGVRRVRFTATADESDDPGFAELEVIGEFAVPQVEARNAAEIPGSSYSGTGSDPQEIVVTIPDAGVYRLDVRGTGEGPFAINVNTLDAVGNIIGQQMLAGTASKGSTTPFDLRVFSQGVIQPGAPHDLRSLSEFLRCFGTQPVSKDCLPFDLNATNNVDLADFSAFLEIFGGPSPFPPP